MVKDENGDGRADGEPVSVANRSGAHGLAIHDGKLYLITVKEVFVADILADGRLGPLTMIIGDLPDAGQHASRTMAFGPDGMLYISVGSTCNACNESNQENATILRASPDGKSRTIFAKGLRNTIGFAWHPVTGELWGMDHGIDFLGDEEQPEELNKIEFSKQYGWPPAAALSVISGRVPRSATSPTIITSRSSHWIRRLTCRPGPIGMRFSRPRSAISSERVSWSARTLKRLSRQNRVQRRGTTLPRLFWHAFGSCHSRRSPKQSPGGYGQSEHLSEAGITNYHLTKMRRRKGASA
jgi:glucose/arabinose dehydrogenase